MKPLDFIQGRNEDEMTKNAPTNLTPLSELGLVPPDDQRYEKISLTGSENYSNLWCGTIWPDDLAAIAKNVAEVANYTRIGSKGRAMEFGIGTSLIYAIITAPFCEEYIAVERSPSNIALLKQWTDLQQEPHPRWEVWREIIGILYAQHISDKSPLDWLKQIQHEHPEIYQALQNWIKLPGDEEYLTRTVKDQIIQNYATVPGAKNPYLDARSMPELLQGKIIFLLADAIDKVQGDAEHGLQDLRPFVGTADICLDYAYHESVNDTLLGTAHSMINVANFARPGALLINNMMEGTLYYEGFDVLLQECYGTTRLFSAMQDLVGTSVSRQDAPIVDHKQEGVKTARDNYSGVSALTSIRNATIFTTGRELLAALYEQHPDVCMIQVADRYGYCFEDERARVTGNIVKIYTERYPNEAFAVSFPDFEVEVKRGIK